MLLTEDENKAVAEIITPVFETVLAAYDFGVYSPDVYQESKNQFTRRAPHNPAIANALLWKYGRLGRERYPQSYTNMIEEVSNAWPAYVETGKTHTSEQTFQWWKSKLDRQTAYITVAYITHLFTTTIPCPSLISITIVQ